MLELNKYGMLWNMPKPTPKRPKRPSDPVQLAKLIGDIATGQQTDSQIMPEPPTKEDVSRVMSMLGKIGGPKGGDARAKALSSKKRSDIAKKAAMARWGKK
jgi:DNA replication initiation complex subunit (GINS family)